MKVAAWTASVRRLERGSGEDDHRNPIGRGQAKKAYDVGQRYNRNFGNMWTYDQIPLDLRSRYDFDQSDRYYYREGYLYQVDPKTMLVQQVISALLR